MKYIYICVFSASLHFYGNALHSSICLNMIVKDETPVITRCLESVKPLIDYWVIVDTGSRDGTQNMIQEYMADVPGELHERPWVDFASNRNEALQLAKGKGDYILIIDADEVLSFSTNFKLPELDKDFYYIETSLGGTRYKRVQLINNRLDWKWTGVVHEALDCPYARTAEVIHGVSNIPRPDGNRSQDPDKYLKDSQVLEKALEKEPNNTRYAFYLAQSYRDAGLPEKSLEAYQKRTEMGGWDQEIFWSLLQIARLKQTLNRSSQEVANSYRQAYAYRPTRVEPLYYLSHHQRAFNDFAAANKTARQGLQVKGSDDLLFVEKWITDYGLLLEYSVSAYWTGQYIDALLASNLLLSDPELPANVRKTVLVNLTWINEKIANLANSNLYQDSVAISLAPDSGYNSNTRYVLYLAQSYKEAGELQKALEQYEKRAKMKGNQTEVYWSLLQAAQIKEALNKPSSQVIDAYKEAYHYNPLRAEALYGLAHYQRKLKNNEESFAAVSHALALKAPQNLAFAEKWVYDYGLLLEYSLAAYRTNRPLEAYLASNLLLASQALPSATREVVEQNLLRIKAKLHVAGDINIDSFLSLSQVGPTTQAIHADYLITDEEISMAPSENPSFSQLSRLEDDFPPLPIPPAPPPLQTPEIPVTTREASSTDLEEPAEEILEVSSTDLEEPTEEILDVSSTDLEEPTEEILEVSSTDLEEPTEEIPAPSPFIESQNSPAETLRFDIACDENEDVEGNAPLFVGKACAIRHFDSGRSKTGSSPTYSAFIGAERAVRMATPH